MQLFILMVAFVAYATAASIEEEVARHAMENPDLFEGDILGIDPEDRNAIAGKRWRWPNGVVPYIIDSSLGSDHDRRLITQAMEIYHNHTCVRFVPKTDEKNYVRIHKGNGCTSYIGVVNKGEQNLSLGNGCMYVGTILHELGHALGFYHEQNRSDRDKHLIIHWDNIEDKYKFAFKLLKPHENILYNEFDIHSVMIYGNFAFTKNFGSKTMEAKNGKPLYDPFTKFSLTKSDIYRVRQMYNCQED